MKLNVKLSRELAQQVWAEDKDCYRNAVRAVPILPGAVYVEGWVITSFGLVTEHGWIEHNGEVVDPTPTYAEQADGKYFPGVRYTLPDLAKLMNRRGAKVPFVFGKNVHGMDNRDYRIAYRDATKAAYGDAAVFLLEHLYKAYPDTVED
jgi:hypothetical protein